MTLTREHQVLHFNHREKMTQLIMALTGFCLASVGWDGKIECGDFFIGFFLCAIGIYGTLFSIKEYTNSEIMYNRFRALRDKIDKDYCNSEIVPLLHQSDKDLEKIGQSFIKNNTHSHLLWASLLLLPTILGTTILIASALK